MANLFLEEVGQLGQHRDAPNLYWALTAIPRPFIDLRSGMETERYVMDLWMPELSDLERAGNDAEFWRAKLDEIASGYQDVLGGEQPEGTVRAGLTAVALKAYPAARDYMISTGYSRDQVQAMHPARVILTHMIGLYRVQRDDMFKWFYLPYRAAWRGAAESERQLTVSQDPARVSVLASLLLPAIGRAQYAAARHHRALERARLIEAIRMHAAMHEGKLPASLDEIAVVPVPIDPIWGQPFKMTRKGDVLVIQPPRSLDPRAPKREVHVELRLAP
jgi:hypothetical protein